MTTIKTQHEKNENYDCWKIDRPTRFFNHEIDYITNALLKSINSNPKCNPPQEWIDEIEKEEQQIKDDFFCNNFDVWNKIKDYKVEYDKELILKKWKSGMVNEVKNLRNNPHQSTYDNVNGKRYWAKIMRHYGFKNVPSFWMAYQRECFMTEWIHYKHLMNHPNRPYQYDRIFASNTERKEFGAKITQTNYDYFRQFNPNSEKLTMNLKNHSGIAVIH
jgi:hypothetical protein